LITGMTVHALPLPGGYDQSLQDHVLVLEHHLAVGDPANWGRSTEIACWHR
jgi:hypothetical protein